MGHGKPTARIKRVFAHYIEIHGPLLAKGLSFSALFASIPLLFLLTLAGSLTLTTEVRGILEAQLLAGLSTTYRESIVGSIERFASRPGSLSVLTIAVFLFSVHNLFFDVHRVVRAALTLPVSPARGRLRAVAVNAVFLLIIYSTAVGTLAAQIAGRYLPLPALPVELLARVAATVLLAATLWALVRLAGGVPIRFRVGVPVFLIAGVLWQGASFLSGSIIRGAGRRLVVYGVLASAVLFLVLMRVFAEVILHSALWVYELQRQDRSSLR